MAHARDAAPHDARKCCNQADWRPSLIRPLTHLAAVREPRASRRRVRMNSICARPSSLSFTPLASLGKPLIRCLQPPTAIARSRARSRNCFVVGVASARQSVNGIASSQRAVVLVRASLRHRRRQRRDDDNEDGGDDKDGDDGGRVHNERQQKPRRRQPW